MEDFDNDFDVPLYYQTYDAPLLPFDEVQWSLMLIMNEMDSYTIRLNWIKLNEYCAELDF